MRKIIHVDMDAFYASIEQRDDRFLRDRPIAVGGSSNRGVVMTASYEARAFGVRSAMPVFKAKRLCSDLVIVAPNFDKYKQASRIFHEILISYSSQIEPLSLDEAFIDVTAVTEKTRSATAIAQEICALINQQLAITASAGVSFNKFLAKLASGLNKPDGVFVIKPSQATALLAELTIDQFHGIGPATAKRLRAAGVCFGRDLQQLSQNDAQKLLGSSGIWFKNLAAGIDTRPVNQETKRKSLSIETTFADNILPLQQLEAALRELAKELVKRCGRAGFFGQTLTLKLKYEDFQLRTRRQTFDHLPIEEATIQQAAQQLLTSQPIDKPVRLIGLGISRAAEPQSDTNQLSLPLKGNRSV